MKYFCSFLLLFVCAFSLSSLSSVAYAAGGAGGSWGDDSGYDGDGGSTGGSGGGGSWDSGFGGDGGSDRVCQDEYQYKPNITSGTWHTTGAAACAQLGSVQSKSLYFNGSSCSITGSTATYGLLSKRSNPTYDPDCIDPDKPLKCPAGYVKKGDNTCVWQCPAGYKMLGGNCVKDDMPEDCDPAIQQCDEDGKPVCDCCASLKQLVNQNNTIINNDNRIISLTETTVSNQNTIINNTENINNNISTVNTNITTTNNKLDQLIQTINENKPDFDTSALEAKLDQLIAKDWSVGDVSLDLDKTNALLAQIDASVKANKYDDTELKAKLDELINKDLSEVTMRQDEQTGLLEQIRDLLRPVKEGELAPSLENEPFEARLDPWSAIRGFDVNQNMINARAQCPSGEAYSFQFFGRHFAMPMSVMCGYLAQLGFGFMFLAYMGAAFIIVKGD